MYVTTGRIVVVAVEYLRSCGLRADQFEHLGDALFAEFDLLGAVGVGDDDAGHAHRAVLVLEFGEVRDVVGFWRTAGLREAMRWEASTVSGHIVQVSETRIMMFSGSVMDFARSTRSSPSGWPGLARVVQAKHERVELVAGRYAVEGQTVKTSEPLPSLPAMPSPQAGTQMRTVGRARQDAGGRRT